MSEKGVTVPLRKLPQSIAAEAAVLGSILIKPVCFDEVAELLCVEASIHYENRRIYEALLRISNRGHGKSIDAVLLRDELVMIRSIKEVGVEYIVRILDSVSSAVNAMYYVMIVREKYPLRRLIIACGDIYDKAYDQFDTVEELDVPVILLSQLNRALAGRSNFMPRLTELSESGSVEQDVDFVLLLHHEDYYYKGRAGYRNTNVADVIIAKQCNGPTGAIKLTFRPEMSHFECCAMADTVNF